MVAIAQLGLEHQVVALRVVGSNPTSHPSKKAEPKGEAFFASSIFHFPLIYFSTTAAFLLENRKSKIENGGKIWRFNLNNWMSIKNLLIG